MKTKTVKLDDDTRGVLLRSIIEGNSLTLPQQLDRTLYVKVAKAIEAAGGKWSRKAGCHLFPHDVRETLDIGEETVSVVNVRQTYQAFYTPPELALRMVKAANILPGMTILEPGAGEGALVRAIHSLHGKEDNHVTAIEIDPKKTCLTELADRCLWGDFLDMRQELLGLFDRVVMNPPFTRGQDVKHILHALAMLKPGGRIVALCADGPKQREFSFMGRKDILAGTFEHTGVKTAMLCYDKPLKESRFAG